jgi:hypothetical protein
MRAKWKVEDGRAVEPSGERTAESVFAFVLRRKSGEQVQTLVVYEPGAKHGSLEGTREIVKHYLRRRNPPPVVLVDGSGIPRADYEGLEWPREERARLVEHRLKASESFDRMVLALAGGALGLTITFIHDIAPHPRHLWMIAVGWSILAASLLVILTSLLTSIAAHDQIIEQMDEQVASVRRPRRWTTWLNRSAAALLVAGVAFVVLFACFNLRHA